MPEFSTNAPLYDRPMDQSIPSGAVGRNTYTNIHKYVVREYVRKTNVGKACWFLKNESSDIIKLREIGEQVSVRRLLYALFIGPLEENVALSSLATGGCQVKHCISPYHQGKEKATRGSRPLNLEMFMDVLDEAYSKKELRRSEPLPRGVTVRQVQLCKHLHREGKTLDEMVACTQLTRGQIYRAIGGIYDSHLGHREEQLKPQAARNSASVDEARRSFLSEGQHRPIAIRADRGRSEDQSTVEVDGDIPTKIGFGTTSGDPAAVEEQGDPTKPPVPDNDGDGMADRVTDEEAWLASLRGN